MPLAIQRPRSRSIIHQIRNFTRFVSYKDLKKVTADLKPIYKAATEEGALLELDRFEEVWGAKYPLIIRESCHYLYFSIKLHSP